MVEPLGVVKVRLPQALRERVLTLGDGDQVDVVGHEVVRQEAQACRPRALPQKAGVQASFIVIEEHDLAVVAALGYVVGMPGTTTLAVRLLSHLRLQTPGFSPSAGA